MTRAWLAMRINPLPSGVRPQPLSGGGLPSAQKPAAPQKKPAGKGKGGGKGGAEGGKQSGGKDGALDAGVGPPPSLSTAEDGGGALYDEWVELLLRCAEARRRSLTARPNPPAPRPNARPRAAALITSLPLTQLRPPPEPCPQAGALPHRHVRRRAVREGDGRAARRG